MVATPDDERRDYIVMKDSTSVDYKHSLWILLRRTSSVLQKTRDKELSQYGISSATSGVIQFIKNNADGVTVGDIAQAVLREPHSISGHIKRLEKEGIVKKVNDLSDKRYRRIILTEKGLQLYHQTMQRESIYRNLSVVSDEDCMQMMNWVEKIFENTIKDLDRYKQKKRSLNSNKHRIKQGSRV